MGVEFMTQKPNYKEYTYLELLEVFNSIDPSVYPDRLKEINSELKEIGKRFPLFEPPIECQPTNEKAGPLTRLAHIVFGKTDKPVERYGEIEALVYPRGRYQPQFALVSAYKTIEQGEPKFVLYGKYDRHEDCSEVCINLSKPAAKRLIPLLEKFSSE